MAKELIALTLPEFCFLSDDIYGELRGRNVIMHVRSVSVVEIIERENVYYYEPDVLYHKFDYTNMFGEVERLVAMLHFSATLDKELDREFLLEKVIKPACEFYMEFAKMADAEMLDEEDEL